jgi:hypothetical protein
MPSELSQYLQLQSASLRLESEAIRRKFKNTTNKGSGFESLIRNQIDIFSPSYWRATQGEIIDSYGIRTGQIDIAVVSSSHPRGKDDGEPEIIMYDAIVAVGEAKLHLTTEQCESARKIVDKLCQCNLHADNNNELSEENYDKIRRPPFFLCAYESNVALSTLEATLCNDIFHCAIIFAHDEKSSAVAISDSVVAEFATKFLSKVGTLAPGTQRVFLVDNPLLVLSWMLTTFSVPMMPLTPILPMYF